MTETTLRARLVKPPIVIAPGIYDPLTALIAERAGFEALYVSGAAIAYTRLGRPDIGLVSMSERVAFLNGQLTIDSAPGHGTRVHVRVPLRRDARAESALRRTSA